MSNENGHRNDDETPPGPVRIPSNRSTVLADLALSLNAVAQHCAEAARLVDSMGSAERGAYLHDLAERLGQLGDLSHEARRVMTDMG